MLAALSSSAVLGQTGPVFPSQAPQVINELTALVVTNTATDANIIPGANGYVAVTNRITFSYSSREALLADGWSFMATKGGTNRNTETTSGLVVDYNQTAHPGTINIPCDLGDLWEMNNNRVNPTRNFLSRTLSANWTNIDLTITFHADTDTQQAGIALYQDDDNFMYVGLGYSDDRGSHPSTNTAVYDGTYPPEGINLSPREFCVWEYGGVLPLAYNYVVNEWTDNPHVHGFNWEASTLTHKIRFARPNPQPNLPWSSNNIYQNNGDPNIVWTYWSPVPGFGHIPLFRHRRIPANFTAITCLLRWRIRASVSGPAVAAQRHPAQPPWS